MDFFGFDPTFGLSGDELGNYSKIVVATLTIGALIGGRVSWLIARWNFSRGSFRHRISFERVAFRDGVEKLKNGKAARVVNVDFASDGDEKDLNALFGSKFLENQIKRQTKRANGLITLPNETHHFRLMSVLEDRLTGNDPRANVDAVMGRRVNENHVVFAPAYVAEIENGKNDMAMVRVFYMSEERAVWLLDPENQAMLRSTKHRTLPWLKTIIQIGNATKPKGEGHRGTNPVWHSTIETSIGAGQMAT